MKWLQRAIIGLAVVIFAAIAAVGWLLQSESGWRWALEKAQSASAGALRIEGQRGTPERELFIERLTYQGAGFRVDLKGIALRRMRFGVAAGITIESLRVETVEVALGERDESRPQSAAPARIALPLGVRVGRAEVGTLTVGTGASDFTFRHLALAYEGGPARHRIDGLTVESPWGALALHGEISASAPFRLSAAGALVRADRDFPVGAGLELSGDLDRVSAALKGGAAGVAVEARALLAPRAPRPLESITARAGPIDLAHFVAGAPSTALTVELHGRGDGRAQLAGELAAANARPGTIDAGRLPLARVESRFTTDFQTLRLADLVARAGSGGTLSGSGEVDMRSARLALRAAGLDLRALYSTLRSTRLSGPLEVVVSAARQSLRGTLSQEGLRLSTDAVRTGDTVDIRSLRASANGGELSGSARVALGAAIGVTGRFALARFDPSQFGDYPQGSINGSAVLEGRLAPPRRIDARWIIEESWLAGRPLASRGSARIRIEDKVERVSEVTAEARLGQTRVSARGAFGGRGDELAWTLDAPRLAELRPDLSGRVRAEGVASGGWAEPRVAFSARAEALRLPGGVAAGSASLKASLGRGRTAPLELELLARDVDAGGVAIARLQARSSGSVSAHEASVSAETAGAAAFHVSARARGGWSEDEQRWSGEVLDLRNDGRYPLRLAAPVSVRASSARIEVGRLDATLGQGRILVRESVWTPGALISSGEFSGVPAAWLLAPAGLAGKLESTLLLDGGWSLRSDPLLGGTLSVRRGGGDLSLPGTPALALGLERVTLDARFEQGVLNASVAVESRLAKLALRGEVKPDPGAEAHGFGAGSPVAFRGQIDVAQIRALVQPFLTLARVDGRLTAELRGAGTLAEPRVTGSIRGEAIRLDVPPYGVYLKDGRLSAEIEGDRVRVTELMIRGGSGSFSASGTLPLRPAEGVRLDWHARDFGVLDRPDMRLVVSGDGAVRLEGERVALSGELRAIEGFIDVEQDSLPDLGSDVVVLDRRAQPKVSVHRLPIALDLQMDLGQKLTVQGMGYDGKVTGRVRLTTDKSGELRADGKVTALHATYLAYGQQLDVDPGELIFAGPIDNPVLQITAWRRNQAVEAGVQISGTVRAPRAQLVSQPAVPDGEKLSWLVLGRPPDDATKADLALLQAAAGALLPRGSSVPLTRRIARTVGLDDITLRGNSELAQQVVAVGKRLSDRFYVSYEQAVGATAANLVKLDYTLSRRWSLRAETGTITGLGLYYRYSWD